MNALHPSELTALGRPEHMICDASATAEWYFDGRIVVFRLHDVARKSADAWSRLVLGAIAEIPPDQPLLFLHDVSAPGVGPTPTIASKMPGLHQAAGHLSGRVAIVMQKSIRGQRIAGFFNSRYMQDAKQINRGFESYEEAIAWLVELL